MLNQTAINDSKGESFPLDFNLKDVTYAIEVEISPGKCTYQKSLLKYRSVDSWCSAAARHMRPYVLYSCAILVFLRTETKKSLKRLLSSNFKSQKELLLVT